MKDNLLNIPIHIILIAVFFLSSGIGLLVSFFDLIENSDTLTLINWSWLGLGCLMVFFGAAILFGLFDFQENKKEQEK